MLLLSIWFKELFNNEIVGILSASATTSGTRVDVFDTRVRIIAACLVNNFRANVRFVSKNFNVHNKHFSAEFDHALRYP